MDIEMKAEDNSGEYPVWDLKTDDGIVPIMSGEKENLQIATRACFLEKGTIPQLSEAGVEWTAFLTNEISFGELDAQIRESLRKADKSEYFPNYQIENDKLTLSVSKEIL